MKDDSVNELARRIYSAHSDALDFIFDNRPDRLAEVAAIFERLVEGSDWLLRSPNKGYTRFLTHQLDPVVPRSGIAGWRDKEAFLFELDYSPKKITFRTSISPGDDDHRTILSEAISPVEGAAAPRGKQWLCQIRKSWPFDVTSEKHSDEDIEKKLREIWPTIEALVKEVESRILEKADLLRT